MSTDVCESLNHRIILSITVLAIIATALAPIIPQWSSYHNFADIRTILGIHNAQNVLTNLVFAFTGIYGLNMVARSQQQFVARSEQTIYNVLFIGSIMVAFGSSYYHYLPNNSTLFWDRLPMTISLMALLAAMISERINPQLGIRLLFPLIVIGMGSVLYWHYFNDLRWYALIQFGPLLIYAVMFYLYDSVYRDKHYLYIAIGFYLLAKLAEIFDHQIYHITSHFISGHAIKHLLAGMTILCFALNIKIRKLAV